MRPEPKCFCSPQVERCPKCTRPNYDAMKPSNGDAARANIVKAMLAPRKLAIAASLALQVIAWTGERPTPEQAAETLQTSPAFSNRTAPTFPLGNVRPPAPTPSPAPSAPPVVTVAPQERDTARAIRMGIPGGYTPLEWAILHSK